MSKFLRLIISFIIAIIITLSLFHISNATNETIWILPEKSQEFEKWENLSDEERANTIEPSYSSVSFKESIKKSKYNVLCSKLGDSLTSSYRISGLTVKNQQATNLCWAFAFSSMLEGSGNGNVYSPAYLDYITTSNYNKQQGNGGNSYISLGSSTSGKYPVLETNMPFESVYDETNNSGSTYYLTPIDELSEGTLDKAIDARITDATYFASIYKEIDSSNHITYTDGNQNEYTTDEVKAIRNLIKEQIQNEGPITAMIYSDLAMNADEKFISQDGYCNINTWGSFCNDTTKSANHAVTIVGWDDNYPVSNFNEDIRPTNPGAYIVLNSYGEGIGENGYIYVSYEDIFIEQSMVGIDELEEYESEEDITYDNIYQYDELGYTYSIGSDSTNLMAANIFSRDSSQIEYLNEVGIFLPTTEGVQVYVNASDDDMTNLTQVAINTDNITPGYHVIKLSSPVQLTGNKFVVAVKYTNTEDGSYIPLEANWKDSGISYFSSYFDTATSNEGESFVSEDEGKSWTDIYNLKVGMITLKNTNACIKAYTTISTTVAVTGVTLNEESLSLEVGDTSNLVATIYPIDATNQSVTWTSSDESVATISDSGIITAISKGTTDITVTTVDGSFSATCKLTVTDKTNTEDDIYKDNVSGTNNNTNNKVDNTLDSTTANKILPFAGNTIVILISITLLGIIMVVVLIKFRSLKDIK